MKKSRYTDRQIMDILKQAANDAPIPDLCREHGMSNATFINGGPSMVGMDASMTVRFKELERENARKCMLNRK